MNLWVLYLAGTFLAFRLGRCITLYGENPRNHRIIIGMCLKAAIAWGGIPMLILISKEAVR